MKAYICDRCGKAYTESNTPSNCRVLGGGLSKVKLVTTSNSIDEIIDLCDDCFKDLFDFLAKGTEE